VSNSKITTGFSIFFKKTFYKHACCWAARRHHIYQIYASYLHVRILYELLGTFQSLKVFGKFKNKSKCFWKPSSKFTIRNGYLVTVYKSGFEACLRSTSCARALVLALEIRWICSPCAVHPGMIHAGLRYAFSPIPSCLDKTAFILVRRTYKSVARAAMIQEAP
jgi:hypothetical protein